MNMNYILFAKRPKKIIKRAAWDFLLARSDAENRNCFFMRYWPDTKQFESTSCYETPEGHLEFANSFVSKGDLINK